MKKHKTLLLLLLVITLAIPSGIGSGNQSFQNIGQYLLYFPAIYYSSVEQVIPTKTSKPTSTLTPTRTRIPFRSATPRPTSTITPTPTQTPTNTLTPTSTSTTTLIPLKSITIQFPTSTISITPTATQTKTSTPTQTPSPGIMPGVPPTTWLIIMLVGILWIALAVWLVVFLRSRRWGNQENSES